MVISTMGSVGVSGGGATFRVLVDGATDIGESFYSDIHTGSSVVTVFRDLPAGSHTIEVDWEVSNGNTAAVQDRSLFVAEM